MYNNSLISLFILFLLSRIIFSEDYEKYFGRANYEICSNFKEGCSFNITKNYPISPNIPTNLPKKAILNDYRYIYLKFQIPSNHLQKAFYLEAYDTNNKKTIISNGDCYLIDTSKNKIYELRIDKNLQKNSFIRLRFFGLSKNFQMIVNIAFELDLILYWTDIPLTGSNSLIKNEDESLKEYVDEMNRDYLELQERQIKTKVNIEKIMRKMFDTTIDIKFEDELNWSETIFIPPCSTVTISTSFGLEISTKTHFKPGETKISETYVINGKIDVHSDGLNLLNKNIYMNNEANKILDLYNKQIQDLVLEFGIETDSYSVTFSTNSNNDCLIITIRYFDNYILKTIYSEVEVKIEIDNKRLKQLIKKQADSIFVEDDVEIKAGIDVIVSAMLILSVATGGTSSPTLLTLPLIAR